MSSVSITETAVVEKGIRSLVDALGVVDAERFISIMNRNRQNYDEWRRKYFSQMTKEEYEKELFDFTEANYPK